MLSLHLTPMRASIASVVAVAQRLCDAPQQREVIGDVCLNLPKTLRATGFEILPPSARGAGEHAVIAKPGDAFLSAVSTFARDANEAGADIEVVIIEHGWPVLRDRAPFVESREAA